MDDLEKVIRGIQHKRLLDVESVGIIAAKRIQFHASMTRMERVFCIGPPMPSPC